MPTPSVFLASICKRNMASKFWAHESGASGSDSDSDSDSDSSMGGAGPGAGARRQWAVDSDSESEKDVRGVFGGVLPGRDGGCSRASHCSR